MQSVALHASTQRYTHKVLTSTPSYSCLPSLTTLILLRLLGYEQSLSQRWYTTTRNLRAGFIIIKMSYIMAPLTKQEPLQKKGGPGEYLWILHAFKVVHSCYMYIHSHNLSSSCHRMCVCAIPFRSSLVNLSDFKQSISMQIIEELHGSDTQH